jgi:anti-sigma factor ChrR (cupin superfamily)
LGALTAGEAQRFEQRLTSGCPLCTAWFAEFSEVTELLALSVDPISPPAATRERLIAMVRTTHPPPPPEMTLVRHDDSPWIRTRLKGVATRPLLGDRTILVRMDPGTVYPAHQHPHDEQCYVLEGSITDSRGITVRAGDFVCMAAGSTHSRIHSDTGCLLLIAWTDQSAAIAREKTL